MSREISSLLSRRNLLAGLGLGAASVGAFATPAFGFDLTGKSGSAGGVWGRGDSSLDQHAMADWQARVGSRFDLAGNGTSSAARLVAVQPLTAKGTRPRGVRKEAFALVFEPLGLPAAGERIYTVRHPDAGGVDMFLSGSGGKRSAPRLQAIFS